MGLIMYARSKVKTPTSYTDHWDSKYPSGQSWAQVCQSNDGDSSYQRTISGYYDMPPPYEYALFTADFSDIPENAHIQKIQVTIRARSENDSHKGYVLPVVKVGTTAYSGSGAYPSTSYTDYSYTWYRNPKTNSRWSREDILNLKFGAKGRSGYYYQNYLYTLYPVRLTYVKIQVWYYDTAGGVICKSENTIYLPDLPQRCVIAGERGTSYPYYVVFWAENNYIYYRMSKDGYRWTQRATAVSDLNTSGKRDWTVYSYDYRLLLIYTRGTYDNSDPQACEIVAKYGLIYESSSIGLYISWYSPVRLWYAANIVNMAVIYSSAYWYVAANGYRLSESGSQNYGNYYAVKRAMSPYSSSSWSTILSPTSSPDGAIRVLLTLLEDPATQDILLIFTRYYSTSLYYRKYDGSSWSSLTSFGSKKANARGNISSGGHGEYAIFAAIQSDDKWKMWYYSGGSWYQHSDVPSGTTEFPTIVSYHALNEDSIAIFYSKDDSVFVRTYFKELDNPDDVTEPNRYIIKQCYEINPKRLQAPQFIKGLNHILGAPVVILHQDNKTLSVFMQSLPISINGTSNQHAYFPINGRAIWIVDNKSEYSGVYYVFWRESDNNIYYRYSFDGITWSTETSIVSDATVTNFAVGYLKYSSYRRFLICYAHDTGGSGTSKYEAKIVILNIKEDGTLETVSGTPKVITTGGGGFRPYVTTTSNNYYWWLGIEFYNTSTYPSSYGIFLYRAYYSSTSFSLMNSYNESGGYQTRYILAPSPTYSYGVFFAKGRWYDSYYKYDEYTSSGWRGLGNITSKTSGMYGEIVASYDYKNNEVMLIMRTASSTWKSRVFKSGNIWGSVYTFDSSGISYIASTFYQDEHRGVFRFSSTIAYKEIESKYFTGSGWSPYLTLYETPTFVNYGVAIQADTEEGNERLTYTFGYRILRDSYYYIFLMCRPFIIHSEPTYSIDVALVKRLTKQYNLDAVLKFLGANNITETRYFRNDEQFLLTNTSSQDSLTIGKLGSYNTAYFHIRVLDQDDNVIKDWTNFSYSYGAVSLKTFDLFMPEHKMPVDGKLKIQVKLEIDGTFSSVRTFTSDLMFTKCDGLMASTWKVKVYLGISRFLIEDEWFTNTFFYYGNSTYKSRIENIRLMLGRTYKVDVPIIEKDRIVPAHGCVLYLPLDGNVYDKSGKGNNGTNHGASWINGKYGRALDFDGSDDYVEIPDDDSLEPSDYITLAAWFKTEDYTRDLQTLMMKWEGYNVCYRWSGSQPYIWFELRGTDDVTRALIDSDIVGEWNIQNNTWYHVVAVYDGQYMKVYINGELYQSKNVGSFTIKGSGANLVLGQVSWLGERYLQGSLDEVIIFERALSEDEVKSLYAHGRLFSYTMDIVLQKVRKALHPKASLFYNFEDKGVKVLDMLKKHDGDLKFSRVTVWDTGTSADYDTIDPIGAGWTKVTSTSHSFTGKMVFENAFIRVIINYAFSNDEWIFVWDWRDKAWRGVTAHYIKVWINGQNYTNPAWSPTLISVSEDKAEAKFETPKNVYFIVELKFDEPYVKIVTHPEGDTVKIENYPYFRQRFQVNCDTGTPILGRLLDRWFVGTYQGKTDSVGNQYFDKGNVAQCVGKYMSLRSTELGSFPLEKVRRIAGIYVPSADAAYFVSRYWNAIVTDTMEDGDYYFEGGMCVDDPYNHRYYFEAEDIKVQGSLHTATRSVTGENVGTGNGSNKTFYLDYAHVKSGTLTVYKDGTPVSEMDYVCYWDEGRIVFNTAPESGASITADYTYYVCYPSEDNNSVAYNPTSSSVTVLKKENLQMEGTYRVFLKVIPKSTISTEYQAEIGGKQGKWVKFEEQYTSIQDADDVYWQALDLGVFNVKHGDTLKINVKDTSSTQEVYLDYVFLIECPESFCDSPACDSAMEWLKDLGRISQTRVDGKFGYYALNLDYYTRTWIEIPDSDDLDLTNKLTISFWWKDRGSPTGTYCELINKAGAYQVFFDYYPKIRFWAYIGGTRYNMAQYNATELQDGNWHLITITYDGTYTKIYIDDQLKVTKSDYTGDIDTNSNMLTINKKAWNDGFAKGFMDNLIIIKDCVSHDFIKGLYNYGAFTYLVDVVLKKLNEVKNYLVDVSLKEIGRVVVPSGCVLYLPMDEGVGSKTYDKSGKENDATFNGDPSWVDGKYGKALDFDGDGDYLEIPHNSSINISEAITIAFWIKAPTPSAEGYIIAKQSWQTYKVGLLPNGKIRWTINTPSGVTDLDSLSIIGDDNWHYVVVTFDSALPNKEMKIYIDGQFDSEKDRSDVINTNDKNLLIGCETPSGTNCFDGILDEVMIFNRALSEDEIKALYNNKIFSYMVDVVLSKVNQIMTYIIDAVLKKLGVIRTYDLDVILKELGLTKPYDLDVVLKKLDVTKQYDLDVILKELGLIKTYDIDVILEKLGVIKSYDLDVVLKELGVTKPYDLDVVIKKLGSIKQYDLDVILKKAGVTRQYDLDTVLKKLNLIKQYNIDVYLKALGEIKQYDIDVVLKKINELKPYDVDVVIKRISQLTYDLDTVLKKLGVTKQYDLDVVLKKLGVTKTYDLDVAILSTVVSTYLIDAVLKKLGAEKSYLVDTLLKALDQLKTYGVDVALKEVNKTVTYLLDFVAKKLGVTKEYLVDVALKKLDQTITYQIDVNIELVHLVNYLIDVVLQKLNETKTYSIDVLLKEINKTANYDIDVALASVQTITYTLDAVLQEIATLSYDVDVLLKELGKTKKYYIDTLIKQIDLTKTYMIDAVLHKIFVSTYPVDVVIIKKDATAKYYVDCLLLGIFSLDWILEWARIKRRRVAKKEFLFCSSELYTQIWSKRAEMLEVTARLTKSDLDFLAANRHNIIGITDGTDVYSVFITDVSAEYEPHKSRPWRTTIKMIKLPIRDWIQYYHYDFNYDEPPEYSYTYSHDWNYSGPPSMSWVYNYDWS